MPLSIFRGRPWPQPGEPLWLDDDQDAALEYQDWLERDSNERCPHCGTRESDWVDPATGRDLRNPSYHVIKRRCVGCALGADAESDLTDEERRDGVRNVMAPFDPNEEDDCIPADDDPDLTITA